MPKRFRQVRSVDEILKSPELQAILEELGAQVMDLAATDSNQAYVDSLEMHVFQSSDRVVVQVGAAPGIGAAVEAKRGTLAKALSGVGSVGGSSVGGALVNYTTRDGRTRKATQAQVDAWTRSRR